jgi:hypothetical protein
MIVDPNSVTPRCDATCRLISKYERPYRFEVIVVGQPPHAYRRVYEVTANSDKEAAFTAIDHFVRTATTSPILRDMAPLGQGKLQ